MNVTILHGVTIGRGSVIATGSDVTKNVPPYSIFGVVPGKVLKYRWNIDLIIKDESMCYNPKNLSTLGIHLLSKKFL